MSKWEGIETAPKEGVYLVWLPIKQSGSRVQVCLAHPNITTIGGVFSFDATCKPTHWHPLPEPPIDRAEAGRE